MHIFSHSGGHLFVWPLLLDEWHIYVTEQRQSCIQKLRCWGKRQWLCQCCKFIHRIIHMMQVSAYSFKLTSSDQKVWKDCCIQTNDKSCHSPLMVMHCRHFEKHQSTSDKSWMVSPCGPDGVNASISFVPCPQVGFTSMSEMMTPEEVMQLLNRCMCAWIAKMIPASLLKRTCRTHHLNKYIVLVLAHCNDAFALAVWNYPALSQRVS